MLKIWDGVVGTGFICLKDKDQCRTVVNTVINRRVPYYVWKFLSSCATGEFSNRSELPVVNHLSFPEIFELWSLSVFD
jgi:hypothetical protein